MYIKILLMSILLTTMATPAHEPVKVVDLNKYSGNWYVIGYIATSFDKSWNYTVEKYTLNDKGNYDILTTYRIDEKQKDVKSKAFIDKSLPSRWKVQFIWPFRADYWIIELGEDYSYAVVGHPKHHFLYIMSRTPKMDETLYNGIVERCKQKGYDVKQIRKQLQPDK